MKVPNKIFPLILASALCTCGSAAFAAQPTKDMIKASIEQKKREVVGKIPGLMQSTTAPPGFPFMIYGSRQTSLAFYTSTNPKTPSTVANIITMDTPTLPYNFYKQQVLGGGWKIRELQPTKAERMGNLKVISANKGNSELLITFNKTAKGSGTVINISTFQSLKTKSRYKL